MVRYKIFAIEICILFLLVTFYNGHCETNDEWVSGQEYYEEDLPYSEFKIERVMTLESEEGNLEYTYYVPVPQNIAINDNEIQKVVDFEYSNSDTGAELTEKNGLIYWKGNIQGNVKVTISLVYHIGTIKFSSDFAIP